jgi:hypothetical protein
MWDFYLTVPAMCYCFWNCSGNVGFFWICCGNVALFLGLFRQCGIVSGTVPAMWDFYLTVPAM